jgi:hypothetical protein
LYYSGWHSWTTDTRQAIDFQKTERALGRAKEEQLTQVEVVMQQEEPLREMVLPLAERYR